MGHWLLKTEADEFGWKDLVRLQRAPWDGVRNPMALKHMRAMAEDDEVFVYHTGSVRAVVGIGKIVRTAYADPKAKKDDKMSGKLFVVDVEAIRALDKPVTLATIKADPVFEGSPLVRMPRLSVMPITDAQWKRVLTLSS